MVTLTCSTTAADGVALVTARVEGAAVPRRVTLANRLDGPVWPPRREGIPEAGWDEDGYVGVVPADGALVLGYASPAPPAEPPLELVRSEPVAEGDRAADDAARRDADGAAGPTGSADVEDRSAAAVRTLGDPRPPRDAVPLPTGAATEETVASAGTSESPAGCGARPESAAGPDARPGTPTEPGEATGRTRAADAPPDPVRRWLDAVEARVATAERLADADDLPAATDAVADAGGLAGAERIAERVADDARALAEVTERAEDLAERADEVDVPVAAYRSLA